MILFCLLLETVESSTGVPKSPTDNHTYSYRFVLTIQSAQSALGFYRAAAVGWNSVQSGCKSAFSMTHLGVL